MKRLKSKILIFLLGGIVFSFVYVCAATINASNISYNNKTLDQVLDELYSAPTVNKYCEYKNSTYGDSSNHYSVGTMYECTVGYDNNTPIKYNFFILSINNDNTVDLIMDRNINSGATTWYQAMKYFRTNEPGASIKATWTNVLDIDIPKAQDIVDAVRNDDHTIEGSNAWCFEDTSKTQGCTNTGAYAWLYSYTKSCSSYNCIAGSDSNSYVYGYWTRDVAPGLTEAFRIQYDATINQTGFSNNSSFGVRPVITVLKSSLYESNGA